MDLKKKIPVILDTDIGGDIDDTWALALMLGDVPIGIGLHLGDEVGPQALWVVRSCNKINLTFCHNHAIVKAWQK